MLELSESGANDDVKQAPEPGNLESRLTEGKVKLSSLINVALSSSYLSSVTSMFIAYIHTTYKKKQIILYDKRPVHKKLSLCI